MRYQSLGLLGLVAVAALQTGCASTAAATKAGPLADAGVAYGETVANLANLLEST
jgi:hypothetical protein